MRCPICKQQSFVIISQGVWDAPRRNVWRCRQCGVTFLHPMMTKRQAEKFYATAGYAARLKRISAKNKSAFLENKLRSTAKRQAALLAPYFNKTQSVADIGASKGHFLQAARRHVKNVVAIEPGKEEARELKVKKIKRYPLLESVPAGEKFGAVTMFHLFEHISKPLAYLQELKRHLAPGALVFVELPNIDDALVSRYDCAAFKNFYFQSMHCFYYNEQSLADVFQKAGFAKTKCLYIQRYSFANHLQWLLQGQPGGNEEYEKKFKRVNQAYADILAKAKVTDTILCIFRKK